MTASNDDDTLRVKRRAWFLPVLGISLSVLLGTTLILSPRLIERRGAVTLRFGDPDTSSMSFDLQQHGDSLSILSVEIADAAGLTASLSHDDSASGNDDELALRMLGGPNSHLTVFEALERLESPVEGAQRWRGVLKSNIEGTDSASSLELTAFEGQVSGLLVRRDSTFTVVVDSASQTLVVLPQVRPPPREAPPIRQPRKASSARRPEPSPSGTTLAEDQVCNDSTQLDIGFVFVRPAGESAALRLNNVIGALGVFKEILSNTRLKYHVSDFNTIARRVSVTVPRGSTANQLLIWMEQRHAIMQKVTELRESARLDAIVAIHPPPLLALSEDGSTLVEVCGLANMLPFPPANDFAFAVVTDDCAEKYYTLAHELGHVLGNEHHRAESDPRTAPAFSYSYGYFDTARLAGDVMASRCYPTQCRRRIYANPTHPPPGERIILGSPDADVAKTVSRTICTIAQFRER